MSRVALDDRGRRTVADFAAQLGLPLRLASDGSAAFHFERSGLLSFCQARDALLISLVWSPASPRPDLPERLLATAGFDDTTGRFVHAIGDERGDAGLVSTLAAARISVPELAAEVDRLIALRRALD